MQAAGLAAPPAPAPTPAPPSRSAAKKIHVVEVGDSVAAMEFTTLAADAPSSAPPASGSAAGANAPPGGDPLAARVAADTAAATALAAEAKSPAAPPARGNGEATTSVAASRKPRSRAPLLRLSTSSWIQFAALTKVSSLIRSAPPLRTMISVATVYCFVLCEM